MRVEKGEGLTVWRSARHQWGPGKSHVVDPDDSSRTACGKDVSESAGSMEERVIRLAFKLGEMATEVVEAAPGEVHRGHSALLHAVMDVLVAVQGSDDHDGCGRCEAVRAALDDLSKTLGD